MTERWRPGASDADPAQARLAEDWVTIWQSEMAALAADREAAEHLQAALAAWLAAAASMRSFEHGRFPGQPGTGARPDASSRAASAAAASAAGDAIDALERRVAELERRLMADAAGT